MRNFWLIISVLWLWTCSSGGGGDKAAGPQEPPIVVNLTSLSGQAQKGPFSNGTTINIAELNNQLSPTGRIFSSSIIDNSGQFSVANVQLESPYVELRANGFYFNEISNSISDAQLTLFALSNLTGRSSMNVNIITHLEKNRILSLMSASTPLGFAQAKIQAQQEVFSIFDFSTNTSTPNSELLDISKNGADNAKLLAISSIVQGDLSVGQMSELIANISSDISSDGTLDNDSIKSTLINNSKNLDLNEIRNNLTTRYASLGIQATIPDFESQVFQFLKPPVVQDITVSMDEDTQLTIALIGSDPEGESITFSIVDQPSNGTFSFSGTEVTYTPQTNYNGTDAITYKANDGTSDSNEGVINIIVNAIDDDPYTNDVSVTTDEDTSIDINLTADEYDGESYSFSIVGNPANGSVSLNDAIASYLPDNNWYGTDTFTFEATDNRSNRTNVATATIIVNPINDPPTSENEGIETDEDTPIRTGFSSLDVEGDPLSYIVVSQPANGVVTIDNSNSEPGLYTPNENFNGTDSFTYKANDGVEDGNTATATVTINPINDAPVALDSYVSTNEIKFEQLTFTLQATDIEEDQLSFTIINNVSNGSTSIDGNQVTYIPNQDWHGSDGLTFVANDGSLDSNTATVVIGVTPVNDAPVVDDMSVETLEDTAVSFKFSFTEVDNDNLTFSVVSNPDNGTISIDGAIASFTPDENWNGNDSFTYQANDGSLNSNIATVSIIVESINDAPVSSDISVNTDEDIKIDGITLSALDIDNDNLTFSIVEGTQNASISFVTSNVVSYTPNDNFNGTDAFTFKANDGILDSNTSIVNISVSSVNDSPESKNIFIATDEDNSVIFSLDVSDIDLDNLNPTLTNPSNGILSVNNLEVTYAPNDNWNGVETFTYFVNDGIIDSNTSTIQIDVNPVEDVPSFDALTYTYTYGTDEYDIDTLYYELDLQDADGDLIDWDISNATGEGTWSIIDNSSSISDSLMYINSDPVHDSSISNIVYVIGTDENGNSGPENTVTINYEGGPQGLIGVLEYGSDWYTTLTDANDLTGANDLRDPSVSYLPQSSTGTTGYIVENRVGETNMLPYQRDFDRFDYWTATSYYDIELNFSETSLAWDYLSEGLNAYVPFAAYAINNFTNERIRLFVGYWESDTITSEWSNDGDRWLGPVFNAPSYEPIYLFWPQDEDNSYDPQNDSQYIAINDLNSSGGCGWANGLSDCDESYGQQTINYPFATAILITTYMNGAQLPTSAGHAAYGTGYSSDSAIIFNTYFDKAESRTIPMINVDTQRTDPGK